MERNDADLAIYIFNHTFNFFELYFLLHFCALYNVDMVVWFKLLCKFE